MTPKTHSVDFVGQSTKLKFTIKRFFERVGEYDVNGRIEQLTPKIVGFGQPKFQSQL